MAEKMESTKPAPIDILYDEGLLIVFSYLNIKDLINIERVSKKWRELSLKSWSRIKKIKLSKDIGQNFPMDHIEDILKRSGNYVTDLDLDGMWGIPEIGELLSKITGKAYGDISDIPLKDKLLLINKYCTNLKKLKITINHKSGHDVNLLCDSVVKKLIGLSIRCQQHGDYKNFKKYVSSLLERAVNLEKFDLSASDIKGDVLFKIPVTCKELSIAESDFDEETFSQVLERLPNLEKFSLDQNHNSGFFALLGRPTSQFSIGSLYKVSNQLISLEIKDYNKLKNVDIDLLNHMTFEKLRVLNFSGSDCAEQLISLVIIKCPLLEELNLQYCDKVADVGFQKLSKLSNLKILNVTGTNIGDNCLVFLGKKLKKLRKVRCSDCDHVTPGGLLKLVEFLPELSFLSMNNLGRVVPNRNFFIRVLRVVEKRPNRISLDIDYNLRGKDPAKLGLSDQNKNSFKYNYVKIIGNSEDVSKRETLPMFWDVKNLIYYVDCNETTWITGKKKITPKTENLTICKEKMAQLEVKNGAPKTGNMTICKEKMVQVEMKNGAPKTGNMTICKEKMVQVEMKNGAPKTEKMTTLEKPISQPVKKNNTETMTICKRRIAQPKKKKKKNSSPKTPEEMTDE